MQPFFQKKVWPAKIFLPKEIFQKISNPKKFQNWGYFLELSTHPSKTDTLSVLDTALKQTFLVHICDLF